METTMSLNEAKQLKLEAGQLFDTLHKMFMTCALPQVKADLATSGDEQAKRLGHLSNLAYTRMMRRRGIYARIRWQKGA